MRSFKQFIEDLKNNIGWARTGLALDVTDPWFKREIESELTRRGIKYICSLCNLDGHYIFAITGGKKEKILDFVKWFKASGDWHYYITKHDSFHTRLTYLSM